MDEAITIDEIKKLARRNERRFYEALGRIVVEFQELESNVTVALCWLSRTTVDLPGRDADYVTAVNELPFKNRLKLLRALLKSYEDLSLHFFYEGMEGRELIEALIRNRLESISTAATACHKLEERRNQVFHSSWEFRTRGPVAPGGRQTKMQTDVKGTRVRDEFVPLEDLVAYWKALRTTGKRLLRDAMALVIHKNACYEARARIAQSST